MPVDENGNRISNEEFKLNYIVDFTESDFANRLVNEINGEIPVGFIVTEAKLQEVAQKLALTPDELYTELMVKKYIDRNHNVSRSRNPFIKRLLPNLLLPNLRC